MHRNALLITSPEPHNLHIVQARSSTSKLTFSTSFHPLLLGHGAIFPTISIETDVENVRLEDSLPTLTAVCIGTGAVDPVGAAVAEFVLADTCAALLAPGVCVEAWHGAWGLLYREGLSSG